MKRVLVVEDEQSLLRILKRGLEQAGYEVLDATSLREARQALSHRPDLIVLDVDLPDGNGIALLRELRSAKKKQPVMILTARDSIEDRVQGFDAGADDCLTKPFAIDELLARLRALQRRSADAQAVLTVEDLELDRFARVATRRGRTLQLTNRQFELLAYLMQHAFRPVSKEMIARDVWKETTATWTNLIAVHIGQLRRKIERPGWPTILHTVRGQGYQLGPSGVGRLP